jgi:hypothetical protein
MRQQMNASMLRGCSILVLQPPGPPQAATELRARLVAAGSRASVNGEPPLEANSLTHIVADGWATVVRRAPSLAARHSGSFAEFAPPVGVNGPLVFVARRWLADTLAAGRRLEEAEYSFAAGGGGENGPASRAPKRRKLTAAAVVESPARQRVTSSAPAAAPAATAAIPSTAGIAAAAAAPSAMEGARPARRRRLYIVGDQNLAGDSGRFPPARGVGALLQARAADAGLELALDPDGYVDNCYADLQTQGVVEMVEDSHLELSPGDIVVVGTQLHDPSIAKITGESRVQEYFDARPVQTDYHPQQLVRRLREKGVSVAYAQLTSHPELALDLARAQQKQRSLEGFLTRLSQDHHRDDAVRFFDLFEGMGKDDWIEISKVRKRPFFTIYI